MSVYNTCQASHAESTVGSVGKVDFKNCWHWLYCFYAGWNSLLK